MPSGGLRACLRPCFPCSGFDQFIVSPHSGLHGKWLQGSDGRHSGARLGRFDLGGTAIRLKEVFQISWKLGEHDGGLSQRDEQFKITKAATGL